MEVGGFVSKGRRLPRRRDSRRSIMNVFRKVVEMVLKINV